MNPILIYSFVLCTIIFGVIKSIKKKKKKEKKIGVIKVKIDFFGFIAT